MGTQLLRAFLFVCAAAATAIAVEPGKTDDAWVLVRDRNTTTMSGNVDDALHARSIVGDGPALWVRQGGKELVIRDAKVLERVRALMAPVDELGRKLEPLGKQEQVWGKQMKKLSKDPERNEAEMEALGHKMDQLGKQMEAIGGEIERASHVAEEKVRVLVDEARANGLAKEAR
jgi:hypothetical protein